MTSSDTRKILIVGPSWVGDMLMAQSLFITLAHRFPNASIDVLAPAWSLPLLARMPEVRRAVEMPLGHGAVGLGVRRELGRSLRDEAYDLAVVLPRSLKAALVPWFANIPRRTGYRGEMRYGLINDMRALDETMLTQTVQRFVALGLPADASLPPDVPYPKLTVDFGNQARLKAKLDLDTSKHIVAFMPGAEYGPAKQWPVEYFAELARKLCARGDVVWVVGSEKERVLGERIAEIGGEGVLNLCGETKLVDAVDLLALADAAVSNDSGLMHVACAVGTEVVAIYGSSTPAYTPPLSEKAKAVYLGLSCSPCFKRTCPLGHTNCLKQVGVDQVLGAVGS